MKDQQKKKSSKTLALPKPIVEHKPNGNPTDPVVRLRLLIHELISEVESLDERWLSLLPTLLLESHDYINFYEEVERFESALIRNALRRTGGHQINAARLLNLQPSTLNAKMKQYHMRTSLVK